ncbi:uncharacterized protein VSU04_009109 isoform 2-T2 [Chlamydotis macqueenii]
MIQLGHSDATGGSARGTSSEAGVIYKRSEKPGNLRFVLSRFSPQMKTNPRAQAYLDMPAGTHLLGNERWSRVLCPKRRLAALSGGCALKYSRVSSSGEMDSPMNRARGFR